MGEKEKERKKMNDDRQKLQDIFDDWITDGIFKHLNNYQVPWKDKIPAEDLDIVYIGQRSGGKYISPFIRRIKTGNTITDEEQEKLAKSLFSICGMNWTHMWATTQQEYNILDNTDAYIEHTTTTTGNESGGKEQTGSSQNSEQNSGYDELARKTGDNGNRTVKIGEETTTDNGSIHTDKVGAETHSKNDTITTAYAGTEREQKGGSITHSMEGTEKDTEKGVTTVTETPANMQEKNTHTVYGYDSQTGTVEYEDTKTTAGTKTTKTDLGTTGHTTEKTYTGRKDTDTDTTFTEKSFTGRTDTQTENGDIDKLTFDGRKDTQTYDNVTHTTSFNGREDISYIDENEKTSYNKKVELSGTNLQTEKTQTAHQGQETYTEHRHGNIGVTTNAQMLSGEREVWMWYFTTYIFEDLDKYLTLSVY